MAKARKRKTANRRMSGDKRIDMKPLPVGVTKPVGRKPKPKNP